MVLPDQTMLEMTVVNVVFVVFIRTVNHPCQSHSHTH